MYLNVPVYTLFVWQFLKTGFFSIFAGFFSTIFGEKSGIFSCGKLRWGAPGRTGTFQVQQWRFRSEGDNSDGGISL
jgi:hypothetical protein